MALTSIEELKELCSTAVPEGLNLEYKLKQDPSTASLSKEDKKSIAEAIVSFANSDGGILIYGIRSEVRDGLDVAASLVPINEVEKFASEMRLVAELNVSPPILGITIDALPNGDTVDSGYAVCRVPSSDHRPHMSTAPNVHRYYKRSFTGSSIMTPSEIRDQILATREAILEPVIEAGGGGSFSNRRGWISISASIVFRLRNVGSRLCREPFLRVSASCNLISHSYTFDSRLGAWKTTLPALTHVHVDDELHCMSLNFLARIDTEVFRNHAKLTVESILDKVKMFPGNDQHNDSSFSGDGIELIELRTTFGAENSSARTITKTIMKRDVALHLLSTCHETIRDMLIQEVGVWRQDLFDEIRASVATPD